MKLTELQNQFIEGLYKKESSNLLQSIKDSKVDKAELLGIYRNNIYSTLINSLRLTFPKIQQIIGKKKFTILAKEFINYNRSYSGNLDEYGDNFGDFFAKKDHNNDEFLSDLAKLEWLQLQSYLVADIAPINIEKLQNLSEEDLSEVKFRLHPSVFVINSKYNLLAKKKPRKARQTPAYFIIYRHNLSLNLEKLTKSEFYFLEGVIEGLSLYQIYEKYQIDIQNSLQKFLSNGVLSDF